MKGNCQAGFDFILIVILLLILIAGKPIKITMTIGIKI
jgi:hypothetical protein